MRVLLSPLLLDQDGAQCELCWMWNTMQHTDVRCNVRSCVVYIEQVRTDAGAPSTCSSDQFACLRVT